MAVGKGSLQRMSKAAKNETETGMVPTGAESGEAVVAAAAKKRGRPRKTAVNAAEQTVSEPAEVKTVSEKKETNAVSETAELKKASEETAGKKEAGMAEIETQAAVRSRITCVLPDYLL